MFQRPTPVVLNLIIINVLVFLFLFLNQDNFEMLSYFQLFNSDLIIPRDYWYLYPNGMMLKTPMPMELYADADQYAGGFLLTFKPVQLVTSMFSHMSVMHIAFNMLALLSIGPPVEAAMNSRRFLSMYLFAGLFSTVMIAFLDPLTGMTIGASGAISGVALAFAFYYPDARLGLLFLPFYFKAKHFVMGFAGISAVLVVAGIATGNHIGGISHFGHLMGIIGGAIYLFGPGLIKKLR